MEKITFYDDFVKMAREWAERMKKKDEERERKKQDAREKMAFDFIVKFLSEYMDFIKAIEPVGDKDDSKDVYEHINKNIDEEN